MGVICARGKAVERVVVCIVLKVLSRQHLMVRVGLRLLLIVVIVSAVIRRGARIVHLEIESFRDHYKLFKMQKCTYT